MLNFLTMLRGANSVAQSANSGGSSTSGNTSRFGQALGAQIAQKGGSPNKIGLQYMNAAANAPQLSVPNMAAMLQGLPTGQQQRAPLPTNGINQYLLGILSGGR